MRESSCVLLSLPLSLPLDPPSPKWARGSRLISANSFASAGPALNLTVTYDDGKNSRFTREVDFHSSAMGGPK
jgi:hypothetical protein